MTNRRERATMFPPDGPCSAMPMTKLCLAILSVAALCGFGPAPFDVAAVPKAKAAWTDANNTCFTRTDYSTASGIIICLAGADHDFALAIHLADQRPLEAYSAQLKIVTADADSGKQMPSEAVRRFRDAQSRFFKAIASQYNSYQTDMAEDYANQSNQPDRTTGMGMGGMGMNNGMGMGMGGM
jgi:hypothetical protein